MIFIAASVHIYSCFLRCVYSRKYNMFAIDYRTKIGASLHWIEVKGEMGRRAKWFLELRAILVLSTSESYLRLWSSNPQQSPPFVTRSKSLRFGTGRKFDDFAIAPPYTRAIKSLPHPPLVLYVYIHANVSSLGICAWPTSGQLCGVQPRRSLHETPLSRVSEALSARLGFSRRIHKSRPRTCASLSHVRSKQKLDVCAKVAARRVGRVLGKNWTAVLRV